jgi:hypothetical protein
VFDSFRKRALISRIKKSKQHMSKIFYTFLLVSVLSIAANAQGSKPNLEYRAYPGTVTTLDGQTIKGYVLNGDNVRNQRKCIFFTDLNDGRTKTTYNPSDLIGYTVENIQYKSLSYSGNIGFGKAGRNFLFVAKPGAVATYIYFAPGDQLVWQKGDEEPVSNASMLMSFKKSAIKLFSDDAELIQKIENKEKGYGMLRIDSIVDEYNKWAAAKK